MDGLRDSNSPNDEPTRLSMLSDEALIKLLRKKSSIAIHQFPISDLPLLPAQSTAMETEVEGPNTPVSSVVGSDADSDVQRLIRSLEPAAQPDELARLPGYRLLRVLGVGGMGVVFEAEDLKLGRRVAIKLIRPNRFRGRHATSRFLIESRSAARLTHDNIVTVYHVGQHGEIPYLVMQLLTGESLASRLQRVGKLVPPEALRVARQIALGLAAAHAEGLLHRDIKPDNIWLEQSTNRVKILDFSLAQLIESETNTTTEAFLGGTPNYIAPERLRGESGDPRSDLFSLGVVLYEMLSGQKPFPTTGLKTALQLAARVAPEPLLRLSERHEEQIRQLVDDLLRKDPSQRIESAAKVIERLDGNIDLQAIGTNQRANRISIDGRDWRTWRLGLLLLVLLCGIGVPTYLVVQPRTDQFTAQRRELREEAYPIKIREAQSAWEAGLYSRLGEILDELQPDPGDPDLRGWEWYYLDSFRHAHSVVSYENSNGFSAVTAVGDVVAWANTGSSIIHIRNIARNKVIADVDLPGETITTLALSGDTRRVACSLESKRVEVWEIAAKQLLMTAPSPKAYLALSESGDRLVSGAGEKITVYDVDSGELLKQFPQRYFDLNGPIAFSPDQKHCAVGLFYPAYLLIYDAQSWTELARFTPYNGTSNGGCFAISWHPDCRQIAVAHGEHPGTGGKISIWNWSENQVETEISVPPSNLNEGIVAISYDRAGEQLATADSSRSLSIYEPAAGTQISTFQSDEGEVTALSWSDDQRFVNGGTRSGALKRFEWSAMRPYITIEATGRAHWLFDGSAIASKTMNSDVLETNVNSFDAEDGRILNTFKSPAGDWIPAIVCSPVENRIAYSSLIRSGPVTERGEGHIYIFRPGELEPEVSIPVRLIKSLAWSPDGQYLVGGQVFSGHAVTVWNATTGSVVWTQDEHEADVESVAWSNDGSMVASKDVSGKIVLWEPLTGKLVRELNSEDFRPTIEDGDRNLAFSPDSRRLAAGYKESLKIWGTKTLELELDIKAHAKSILSLSWSQDGKRIASGGQDGFTNIWNAETGQKMLSFPDDSGVALVAFSPNGRFLATHAMPLGLIKIRRSNSLPLDVAVTQSRSLTEPQNRELQFGARRDTEHAASTVSLPTGENAMLSKSWPFRRSSIQDRRIHNSRNSEQSVPFVEPLEARQMLNAGALDLTFDFDGFNVADIDQSFGHRAGSAIAVQSDGKIVAAGFTGTSNAFPYQGVIARFNADGSLDQSFGNNGVFIEDANGSFGTGGDTRALRIRDIAVDSMDRIVYAGEYGWVGRLDPNGAPDASFGNTAPYAPGRFFGGLRYSRQFKIVMQPDDSFFVAGIGENIVGHQHALPYTFNDAFVYKLTPNGLPDTSFGVSAEGFPGGGIAYADFDRGNERVFGANVDAAGNIVLVGDETISGSTTAAAFRFTPSGSIDSSFGVSGKLVLFGRSADDVVVDANGRLVISGLSWVGLDDGNLPYISRLDTSLNYDSTFGGDGLLGLPAGGGNLAIQSDEKIIVSGAPDPSNGAIGRVNPNGTLDTSFGVNGIRWINFPPRGGINDIALQADEKVVFVGGNFNLDGDTFSDYVLFVGRLEGDVQPVPVSGRVYSDANNDGSFQFGLGENGIGGVTVILTGTDISNNPINRTTSSLADGSFTFEDVLPGTYSLSSDQPVGFLDGKETAGNFGGAVDNSTDNNSIANFVIGTDGTPATDYLFGEVAPAELSGMIWEDFNSDTQVNFGEAAIANGQVTLTGTDDRGNAVSLESNSDEDGVFMFFNLRPGSYTLTETQPSGYVDAGEALGTIDAVSAGVIAGNDQFGDLALIPGSVGINYNFAERPENGGQVSSGQTATIGFWQNNNGRALILALNGGAAATQLSSWLAATLPNMYGASAGASNLTGMTNNQVWNFYNSLFRRKQQEARALGLGGPVKTDAQIFATALAVYVTNLSLAGSAATSYGFSVTDDGVGVSTINVGNAGQAFGVANNSVVSVMDLLLAVNARSDNGVLYDMDGDGDANDSLESLLRTLANNAFTTVNEQGDI